MYFQECLDIKNQNLHLIGEEIEQDEKNYRIDDVVITPSDEHLPIFLTDYEESLSFDQALNRFKTRNDLSVKLFVTDLDTLRQEMLTYEFNQ